MFDSVQQVGLAHQKGPVVNVMIGNSCEPRVALGQSVQQLSNECGGGGGGNPASEMNLSIRESWQAINANQVTFIPLFYALNQKKIAPKDKLKTMNNRSRNNGRIDNQTRQQMAFKTLSLASVLYNQYSLAFGIGSKTK